MTLRENYMDDPAIGQKWLHQLSNFIKHDDINFGDLNASALLVIDMQKFFTDASSHAFIPSSKSIIDGINSLIKLYAEKDMPVIFTRHALLPDEDPGIMAKWWKDTLIEGTEGAELTPELAIPENALIIRKTTYDAFHNSDLFTILDDNKIKTLVITGVMTHLCCETTARTAFIKNFNVLFVIDGTVTMNEELHLSAIRTLADGFAVPCTTSNLVEAVNNLQGGGDGHR